MKVSNLNNYINGDKQSQGNIQTQKKILDKSIPKNRSQTVQYDSPNNSVFIHKKISLKTNIDYLLRF